MSTSYWQTFLGFMKVGAVSFGGGPPSIPMLHKELVESRALTEREFTEGLALGNALPGPILTNMAVYAGMKVGGVTTALVSVAGAIVPSVFIMGAAVVLFLNYHQLPEVQAALKAIRPAVIALLAFTVFKLAPASVFSLSQAAIAAVLFIAMVLFNAHPALVIILAGLTGVLIYR